MTSDSANIETIDMTPAGIVKDPARVQRAAEAWQHVQADATNVFARLIRNCHENGGIRGGQWVDSPKTVGLALMAAIEREDADLIALARQVEDAREEFLRALGGHPPVASNTSATGAL